MMNIKKSSNIINWEMKHRKSIRCSRGGCRDKVKHCNSCWYFRGYYFPKRPKYGYW